MSTTINAIRNLRASREPVRTGRAALLQAVKHNAPMVSRATIPTMKSVVFGENVSFEMLKFIEKNTENSISLLLQLSLCSGI